MRREPLIQLRYRRSPWRVVVACYLLNRTTGRQVEPILSELFRRWPKPIAMATAGPELEELIRPLGLWRVKADTLRRLGERWDLLFPPGQPIPTRDELLRLPGAGPYAADAVDLVVRRHLDVEPADKELRRWLAWERHRVNRKQIAS